MHAIDDRLRAEWPGERGAGERWYSAFDTGLTIRGVRHARNRVHHQWADAIAGMRVSAFTGLRGGIESDAYLHPPLPGQVDDALRERGRWRWVAELPLARDDRRENARKDEQAYRDRLAGRYVRDTFDELALLFESVREALKHPHM